MTTVDFMCDLETLGKSDVTPVVLQITMVRFDMDPANDGSGLFNEYVNPASCLAIKCVVDPDTVTWWLKQSQSAINRVLVEALQHGRELSRVLDELTAFMKSFRYDSATKFRVWGNGSLFDNKILRDLYTLSNKPLPWKYNEDCDMRTLVQLANYAIGEDIKKTFAFEGIEHNAVDDCFHQIKIAKAAFAAVRQNR